VRTHLSVDLNVTVRLTPAQSEQPKPEGFWYEVDGDWQRWSRAERWWWKDYKFIHEVDLGETNVLMLSTAKEILAFTKEFGAPMNWSSGETYYMNWPLVTKSYDGIEIAPYCWELRLDERTSWYYGWDCASGCVWRPKNMVVTRISEFSTKEMANE
jgi:hypothetical protein